MEAQNAGLAGGNTPEYRAKEALNLVVFPGDETAEKLIPRMKELALDVLALAAEVEAAKQKEICDG